MSKIASKKRPLPRLKKPGQEIETSAVTSQPEVREPTGVADQAEVTMITIQLPVVLPAVGEEHRLGRIDLQLIECQAYAAIPVRLGCQASNARLLRKTDGVEAPVTPITTTQDVGRYVFQEIWLAIDKARRGANS